MSKYIVLAIIVIGLFSVFSSASAAEDGRILNRMNSGSSFSGVSFDCVRLSVATREASVRSAYVAMTTQTLAALDTRSTKLNESWMLDTRSERKSMRDEAWKTWKSSVKSIRETFRNERKTAWSTYKQQVSACGTSRSEMEPQNAQMFDVQ